MRLTNAVFTLQTFADKCETYLLPIIDKGLKSTEDEEEKMEMKKFKSLLFDSLNIIRRLPDFDSQATLKRPE